MGEVIVWVSCCNTPSARVLRSKQNTHRTAGREILLRLETCSEAVICLVQKVVKEPSPISWPQPPGWEQAAQLQPALHPLAVGELQCGSTSVSRNSVKGTGGEVLTVALALLKSPKREVAGLSSAFSSRSEYQGPWFN